MKKNQKILVAVLAIVIVLAVVIFAIAMNKDNTNETSSSSNVETSEVVSTSESTKVESSTEVIASIGTAPEDSQSSVDKSGAINFPGDESSETEASTSESNTVTSNTEVSTSESNTQTSNTKNETSESKTETSVSSTSESSTSKTETSTSETTPVEPGNSESSTSTTVPDNSSSTPSTPAGEQITQGSTGTTSLGTTYPIVSEFNKLGLNPNYNDFFSSDGMATEFTEAMGQANRTLSDVLGYPSTQIAINATNTYISCLDAHITRQPDKSQYVFTYADNITTDSDGGTIARARHQVMLGAITSTPVEVEAALFEATFGNNSYGLDENGASWTTVGDCKLIWAYGDESKQVYYIKPAN